MANHWIWQDALIDGFIEKALMPEALDK